jgi:hypothetical protein
MMFRLGTGGDSPNALNVFSWPDSTRRENNQFFSPPGSSADPFSGGDKGIVSLKGWMDAVMTRLWEIGSGEYWYRPNNRDAVKLICSQPVISATQDNWQWNSGTSTLTWQSLRFAFENSTVYFNSIADGSAVLSADGQCLYVDLQRSSSASALVPVVGTLVGLGTPTIPGSRFILAWRYGGAIYVRDRGFEVGRAYPVATTTVLGIVKLSRAATTPLAPIVLADSERNAANGVAGLDGSQVVLGTGISRGTTFSAGTLSVGTGTNDSAVSIAKSSTTTTINGPVLVKDTIDTAAANTMSIGTTNQTGLTIGHSGANLNVAGANSTIAATGTLGVSSTGNMTVSSSDNLTINAGSDGTGTLNIGTSTGNSVTLGRLGGTTQINGATTTVNGFTSATFSAQDGATNIGNDAGCTQVNVGRNGINTHVDDTLTVDSNTTVGGTLTVTGTITTNSNAITILGGNPASSSGFANTLTPLNIPKAWAKIRTVGGGSPTINIVSGFNVASASYTGSTIILNIQTDLAGNDGVANVTPTSSSLLFQAAVQFDSVWITAQDLSAIPGGGLPFNFYNFQAGGAREFYVVVYGPQ